MALPAVLPHVQGARVLLGPEAVEDTFLVVPGAADYVTNGYVITALQCRLKLVRAAWVSGSNATASPANAGWYAVPVFPIAQMGAVAAGAGFSGYSQFLFKLYVAATGVELANGGSVAGAIWQVTVQGF